MKKLIIILFLCAFNINAQIQLSEDYSFAKDKQLHVVVGAAISTGTYMLVYKNTQDVEWARHVSIFVGVSAAFGKEFFDGMTGNEISLSDASYTAASSIATSWLLYGGHKIIQKRKQRKEDKLLEFEDETWSLDNKFLAPIGEASGI